MDSATDFTHRTACAQPGDLYGLTWEIHPGSYLEHTEWRLLRAENTEPAAAEPVSTATAAGFSAIEQSLDRFIHALDIAAAICERDSDHPGTGAATSMRLIRRHSHDLRAHQRHLTGLAQQLRAHLHLPDPGPHTPAPPPLPDYSSRPFTPASPGHRDWLTVLAHETATTRIDDLTRALTTLHLDLRARSSDPDLDATFAGYLRGATDTMPQLVSDLARTTHHAALHLHSYTRIHYNLDLPEQLFDQHRTDYHTLMRGYRTTLTNTDQPTLTAILAAQPHTTTHHNQHHLPDPGPDTTAHDTRAHRRHRNPSSTNKLNTQPEHTTRPPAATPPPQDTPMLTPVTGTQHQTAITARPDPSTFDATDAPSRIGLAPWKIRSPDTMRSAGPLPEHAAVLAAVATLDTLHTDELTTPHAGSTPNQPTPSTKDVKSTPNGATTPTTPSTTATPPHSSPPPKPSSPDTTPTPHPTTQPNHRHPPPPTTSATDPHPTDPDQHQPGPPEPELVVRRRRGHRNLPPHTRNAEQMDPIPQQTAHAHPSTTTDHAGKTNQSWTRRGDIGYRIRLC
ncbi:PE family protein [Nocardia niigatensis]